MPRMRARRLLAPALAASFLFAFVGGAAAAPPPSTVVVDPYYCSLTDIDGNPLSSIKSGADVIVFQGWFASTRGEVQSFLLNVEWVLQVNGTSVDLTPTLTDILNLRPGLWAVFFQYNAVAAGGRTFTTHYDNVMKSANYDGFVHWAKGSLYNGGVDCSFPVR